jgi:hypothetical protein
LPHYYHGEVRGTRAGINELYLRLTPKEVRGLETVAASPTGTLRHDGIAGSGLSNAHWAGLRHVIGKLPILGQDQVLAANSNGEEYIEAYPALEVNSR